MMGRTESGEAHPRKPSLKDALIIALGLGLTLAGFIVALVGHPTWPVRIGAVGFVVIVVAFVVVWHLGFRAGAKWPRPD
jgi:hypothetical protein